MERVIELYISYLFVDASYFKVRDEVKYINKSLLVVAGVRTDGIREILGSQVADAEHELTWEGIFIDLKERGLNRVDLVISEGHTGIQSVAARISIEFSCRRILFISFGLLSENLPENITKRSLRP